MLYGVIAFNGATILGRVQCLSVLSGKTSYLGIPPKASASAVASIAAINRVEIDSDQFLGGIDNSTRTATSATINSGTLSVAAVTA